MQNVWANDFATVRSVETGSWFTRSHQGKGYGTEARAAALELVFGHLRAAEAHTSFVEGNAASEKVSSKLGYVGNGRRVHDRDGVRTTEHRMLLEATAWTPHRTAGISIDGINDTCLELFGAISNRTAIRVGLGVL